MALTKLQSNGLAVGAVTDAALSNTGVAATTYGGQTAIPVITIDANIIAKKQKMKTTKILNKNLLVFIS